MNNEQTFEVEDDPIARVMYKRYLKGSRQAEWYLETILELGDNDDSHAVVGEW